MSNLRNAPCQFGYLSLMSIRSIYRMLILRKGSVPLSNLRAKALQFPYIIYFYIYGELVPYVPVTCAVLAIWEPADMFLT